MQDNISDVLKDSFLFKSFSTDEINKLIKENFFTIHNYPKDSIIFLRGNKCNSLNMIIEGNIELQQNDSYGNTLTLTTLSKGNMFGENLIFGTDNVYPVDVVSKSQSIILRLNKDKVNELIKTNFNFTNSFLSLLSNKAQLLNKKLRQVTLKSLRDMIIDFLLSEQKKQNSSTIKLNMTKQALADSLGVQRPSLSRELIKMKNEGLIDYDRKFIKIINLNL